MKSGNYILFSKQLHEAVLKYPNLSIKQDGSGKLFLKGILDIPNDLGIIVGHYLIEIHASSGFPYRFPVLFEVGEAILNEADWHKYSDGSCCITVAPDEIRKCKNGISVLHFIEKYCISFFANHLHRLAIGKYKNGEYAHGKTGLSQFYEELLLTQDKNLWIQYYKQTFGSLKVKCGRNDSCFCGANKKYKQCHLVIFDYLRQIGKERVLNDYKLICQ